MGKSCLLIVLMVTLILTAFPLKTFAASNFSVYLMTKKSDQIVPVSGEITIHKSSETWIATEPFVVGEIEKIVLSSGSKIELYGSDGERETLEGPCEVKVISLWHSPDYSKITKIQGKIASFFSSFWKKISP